MARQKEKKIANTSNLNNQVKKIKNDELNYTLDNFKENKSLYSKYLMKIHTMSLEELEQVAKYL